MSQNCLYMLDCGGKVVCDEWTKCKFRESTGEEVRRRPGRPRTKWLEEVSSDDGSTAIMVVVSHTGQQRMEEAAYGGRCMLVVAYLRQGSVLGP